MSSSKRHFTAVEGSKEHGLFISSSPSSAARKIVSKLCASNKSKKVQFYVREITQGSKKKTYGPYLGEMKKLAKPIELKGRVIKYAPSVHLDKKKAATKTVKKNGKKMKGGFSTLGGVEGQDFYFDQELLKKIELRENNNGKYRYSLNKVDPVKVKTSFGRKHLFFGKVEYITPYSWNDNQYGKYYLYVVYKGKNNEVVFRKNNTGGSSLFVSNNPFVKVDPTPKIDISDIYPVSSLNELKIFLDEKRVSDPTFCNEIYEKVTTYLQNRQKKNI